MRAACKCLVPILFCAITAFLAACQTRPVLAPNSLPGIGVAISSDQCPSIEVQVGQQVTWTNTDSKEHTVRHNPEDGESQFNSGSLEPGASFGFLFVEAGTYPYACSEGGGVNGSVIVQP